MSEGVGVGLEAAGPLAESVGPVEEYRRRQGVHEERAAKLRAMHLGLGYARLATALGFLGVAWFTIFLKEGPRWMVVVPMVLFVALGVWQGRVSRRRDAARRAVEMYRLGMARVEDRWMGLEEREVGAMSVEMRARLAASLYAEDLDIVGRGGMFELLCRARTRMGEEMLLGWLLEPAGVGEIRERQMAVEELRGRLDFRERMGVAGETSAVGVQAAALLAWAEAEDVLTQAWMPWVAGLLTVAAVAGVGWWLSGRGIGPLLVVLLLEAGVRRPFEKRMEAVLAGTGEALKNMQLLAGLLEVMEGEAFGSERLVGVKGKLAAGARAGAGRLRGRLGGWGGWGSGGTRWTT